MTLCIIAGIILALVAVAEIVAGIFTERMYRKRGEGLDRRLDAIVEREGRLDSREIQLDRREAEVAEREKKAPQGVLPGDPIKVVMVNRPIRKLRTKACLDFGEIRDQCDSVDDFRRAIECYTEQVKDGLRERICAEAKNLVTFAEIADPSHWNREIIAELWVAEGGPGDGGL